jgi:hypothetical protein
MAIFLDNLAFEFGRAAVLVAMLTLGAWTVRSLVRIWLPVIRARQHL